jgi:glycosyltransferase involved in cell wall biosynthesis
VGKNSRERLMKILTSCYLLDLSGTPTYTVTLFKELVKRGHDVVVYSITSGMLAKELNVVTDLSQMPWEPDVILGQHNVCCVNMREKYPSVPMIFSAHSTRYELEQPPQIEVQWYTAINEDVKKNLIAKGADENKIDIVRDFVDIHRFKPINPLNESVKRILYISNFKKWKTYSRISEACRELGIEMKAVGATYGRCYKVEEEINKSDLVISIGRGIIESMSCGRPVISYDKKYGDGYLTEDVYMESRVRNFGDPTNPAICKYCFSTGTLIDEIKKYNPLDGEKNRNIVLDHHNHEKGVDQLLSIAGRVCEHS